MADYLVYMKQTKDRGKIRAVDHENLILKKKTYYITDKLQSFFSQSWSIRRVGIVAL